MSELKTRANKKLLQWEFSIIDKYMHEIQMYTDNDKYVFPSYVGDAWDVSIASCISFFFSNKRMKHGYWNKNKKIKHWTQACKKNQTLEGWAENYITRWSVGNDVI